MIVWQRDPEFSSATRAEHAFVEGYELVAFDIPPGAGGAERTIGWEVWLPKTPKLGSPEKYAERLRELMDDNDAFDELIKTLESDRSITREGMRQIATAILDTRYPRAVDGSQASVISAIVSHPTRGAGRSASKGLDRLGAAWRMDRVRVSGKPRKRLKQP